MTIKNLWFVNIITKPLHNTKQKNLFSFPFSNSCVHPSAGKAFIIHTKYNLTELTIMMPSKATTFNFLQKSNMTYKLN